MWTKNSTETAVQSLRNLDIVSSQFSQQQDSPRDRDNRQSRARTHAHTHTLSAMAQDSYFGNADGKVRKESRAAKVIPTDETITTFLELAHHNETTHTLSREM